MPADPIITVSGLRGVVGESLTAEIAQRYVAAFLTTLPPGPVVVTRDGRANGPPLAKAIIDAVVASGRTTLDAGVAATPTTGVLIRQHAAAGGVQLSASHNPAEYNGIKLFSRDGRVIPAVDGERVLAAYQRGLTGTILSSAASAIALDNTITAHLALAAATCDVSRLIDAKFRVLLDANHGAGSVLGLPLLAHLGCKVTVLGSMPDGLFAHPPEPTEANLADVAANIVESQSAVGFCQDPDADRLAIIDERGRYIGEEKTLAICVDHVLRSRRLGPIVTNCSTSRMTEDLAAKYGVPFFRSKVGEANVVDLMLEKNAILGGEGNGGVIDPRVGLVRDSFVGMALILDAMASRGLPVSALADELPQYAIHKTTIQLPPERVEPGLAALENHFWQATPDRLDGLRLDFPDGAWLLVRASNTEPIVRAIAEAGDVANAKRRCDEAARVLCVS